MAATHYRVSSRYNRYQSFSHDPVFGFLEVSKVVMGVPPVIIHVMDDHFSIETVSMDQDDVTLSSILYIYYHKFI